MARKKDEGIPTEVAIALANIDKLDDDLKAAIKEILVDYVETVRERKRQREQFVQNRLKIIQQEREARRSEQERCTHRKEDGSSRLVGQRLTGTGQLCFVCLGCAKSFYYPAYEGQEEVPKELIPHSDAIGG